MWPVGVYERQNVERVLNKSTKLVSLYVPTPFCMFKYFTVFVNKCCFANKQTKTSRRCYKNTLKKNFENQTNPKLQEARVNKSV